MRERPRPILDYKAIGPFDLGRVARMHRACFDDAWSRSDLAHLLALPGGFGLIARQADHRVGSLSVLRSVGFSLCRVVADEAELLSLGVVPHARNRAIGAGLLEISLERALTQGARLMFLEVAVDNGPAQALYRRFGFDVVGRREGYYKRPGGERIAALTMRCALSTTAETVAELA
ncbi:MAG: GNAT family N-acetyltransferase [Geminicoccaceae bacterium]